MNLLKPKAVDRPTGRILGGSNIMGERFLVPVCRNEKCGAIHYVLGSARYDYAPGFGFDAEYRRPDGSVYLVAVKP